MSDAILPAGLVATAALYAVAAYRQWTAHPERGGYEAVAFIAGLMVVATAVASPLDSAAHRSLWVHMVQHVLLISVAAPLLALGRPLRVARSLWSWPCLPVPRPGVWTLVAATGALQVGVLLVWHLPSLYDKALGDDAIHGAEHLSLLLSAVALWAALDNVHGDQGGLAVVALFVVSLPPLLLGFAMTFATTAWYEPYAAAGPSAVTDQQIAGAVMWAYGGLAAVVGGVGLFVRWLRQLEGTNPSRQRPVASDRPIDRMPSC